MPAVTYTLPTSFGDIPVTVTERGQGTPVLLLHGVSRPDSVAGFADLLAAPAALRVLTPVNPGFSGFPLQPQAARFDPQVAEVYRDLLDHLDLAGVTVVGSSIGGWAAAELALAAGDRVGKLILLDAAGLDSAEHPITDFFSLTLDQVTDLSWANPGAHRIDTSAMTDAQTAIMAGNRAALQVYGGQSMADPGLAARLVGITVPTLAVWGEADRMTTPAYGKQYAAAIPGAEFHVLPRAGHLPQMEAPEALLTLFEQFTGIASANGEN